MIASTRPSVVLCLDGGQATLLRNLLEYAHRRSTFVSEYEQMFYLCPSEDEWDSLQAIVADLEGMLMSDCSDLMAKLDDILASLACICPLLEGLPDDISSILTPYVNNPSDLQDWFDYTSALPDTSSTSPSQGAACAIAQLWYQAGYEAITEGAIPAARFAFDTLLPALAGLFELWLGGATPPAVSVYLIAEAVQEALESAWNALETNLVNWMQSAKDDIVCSLYFGILGEGTYSSVWSSTYADVIADSEDISAGDKIILYLLMGQLAGVYAKLAYDAASTWATTNVTAGYCDTCEEPPVVGSDWYAVPIDTETYSFSVCRPENGAPQFLNAVLPRIAGQTLVGARYVVTARTGNAARLWGTGTGPIDGRLWTDGVAQSPSVVGQSMLMFVASQFDDSECQTALSCTTKSSTNVWLTNNSYTEVFGKIGLGNYTEGGCWTFTFTHMVYKGSPA